MSEHPFVPIFTPVLIEHIEGMPVFVNEEALKLDGLIVCNRIKPHTAFHGLVESGLLKMLFVGLGGPVALRWSTRKAGKG